MDSPGGPPSGSNEPGLSQYDWQSSSVVDQKIVGPKLRKNHFILDYFELTQLW